MRKIELVSIRKKIEMKKVFNDYLTELSQFDPEVHFDEKGSPVYKWFDCYWTDKTRFPFYLLIDNKVAGFAMIREIGVMSYDFAEFYVCPEFRKNDNAIWFAKEIANLFDGQFSFSTRFTNPRAIKFWGKFASLFENASFHDDEIWRNWTIRKNNFKNHTLNLMSKYFDLIKNQEKILEGRLNDEKRKSFNIGDTITFYKEPEKKETVDVVILDKFIFKDFEEMSLALDKNDLGFANSTSEEMINTYRTIYNRENENKYGVVIFKIKTI